MSQHPPSAPVTPATFRFSSLLRARCPACHQGKILHYVFGMHRRCAVCGLDFYPEPGYFLGAMAVSFLLTAMVTIPPMVVLKLLEVELFWLLAFPFIEFIFVGSFLLVYARVLWIHLDYRMSHRLQ